MACAPVTLGSAFATPGPAARSRRDAPRIDALFIDETIELPRPMAAFASASRQSLPVVGLSLDAAAHAGLGRVLAASNALVGLSCGATLFCLERIAWDHGFRLVERRQQLSGNAADDTCLRAVCEYLGATASAAAGAEARLVRSYRPSRADGLLHAWLMQKRRGAPTHLGPREA
jgi:hypothetical protein